MDPQPYRPAGVDAGYRVDVLYFRVQYVGVYSHRPVERHRGRFRDYRGPGRIVDYGLCLGRGAGFAAVDARGSEDGVPAADARGAGAFHCEPRVVRTFVFLCDADGFADRCGLCACGVLVDRFAAGGPRRTEGSAIGCIGIDYHGNVDCHDRRSAAGSRDRTLRGMADDLLLSLLRSRRPFGCFWRRSFPGSRAATPFRCARCPLCWETPLSWASMCLPFSW